MLCLVAVVGQVTHLDALYLNAFGLAGGWSGQARPAFLTVVAGDAVLSVVTAFLALSLAFKGRAERGHVALGVALSAWSYLLAYAGVVALLRPSSPMSPMRTLFEGHFLLVEMLGLAGLLRFTVLFPQPLSAGDLRPPDDLPVGLRTVQHLRIALLRPATPWLGALVALVLAFAVNASAGRSLQQAPLHPLVDLFRLAAVALVIVNLRSALKVAGGVERVQMHWLVVGFVLLVGALGIVIGGNVLLAATGWTFPRLPWRPLVLDLGVVGLLWGLAMAAFYGGPLEAAGVGRRAIVLASLGTLGLLLAAGLEALLSDVLLAPIVLPAGLGTILAFVTLTFAFARLRQPLERGLESAWTGAAQGHGVEPAGG